jgi:phosphatidylinositol alpha-1,6-mannosyltransferase
MNILLVAQDFPPASGGVQTYSLELAGGLARLGHQVRVLAPAQAGDRAVDEVAGFEVHRVRTRPELMRLAAVAPLMRLCRQQRPDVIIATTWQVAPAALLCRRSGLADRVTVAAHGRELLLQAKAPWQWAGAVESTHRRNTLNAADAILAVSHFTAGLVRSIGVDRPPVHVVPNGVDVRRFSPGAAGTFRHDHNVPPDTCLVLTVCRLVGRKGVDTLVRTMGRLRDLGHNDVHLVVIGSGPEEGRLRELTADLNCDSSVTFAGRIPWDALPDAYRSSDVFAMPAREERPDVEGFGLVFLEASACGLPVIGARTGGIPDAVDEPSSGFLVEADDVDAIARHILWLKHNPDESRAMGRRGAERVRDSCTWDHVAATVMFHLASPTAT